MAIIILRNPDELAERDRLAALNRKRQREGTVQLIVHEKCACGCGAYVPQEGREGNARFFVNDDHYQAMLKRTRARVAAQQRDKVI